MEKINRKKESIYFFAEKSRLMNELIGQNRFQDIRILDEMLPYSQESINNNPNVKLDSILFNPISNNSKLNKQN